jgi:hypothetical protein
MIDANPFRFPIPCPHCGQTDLQVVADLVGKDEIACRFCGEMIDLTNEKWQSGLAEFIESLRQIQRFKP